MTTKIRIIALDVQPEHAVLITDKGGGKIVQMKQGDMHDASIYESHSLQVKEIDVNPETGEPVKSPEPVTGGEAVG